MSKYPIILFFRLEQYDYIDAYIAENQDKYNCSFNITSDVADLNKLYNPNYHLLVTFGENEKEYHPVIMPNIVNRLCSRWLHKTQEGLEDIAEFNRNVNYCYISNIIGKRERQRPTFSIFTTCYKTWGKFDRVYKSLLSQKFVDWEWVIIDDTPLEDDHFAFLREKTRGENRIRLYCRSENSGNIGNVKNEAVALCRGQYVLELDHDDEILPDCLYDAVNAFEADAEVGFVYMDFANIYEDNRNFHYGDFICKGYGGYYCERYKGNWIYVYNTPNINNITLSHLICCPNHPRIWRKSLLMAMENYSESLHICDDYEILLKTAVNTKMCKISKLSYIQYMNNDNNNFSLIRNSEINRIGPNHLYPQFYNLHKVNQVMRERDAFEDPRYLANHSQLWKRPADYEHKYCNTRICNYRRQYLVLGAENLDQIRDLYLNKGYDFLLLDNKLRVEELFAIVEQAGYDRVKCYALSNCMSDELVRYFKLIYKSDDCGFKILDNYSKILFDFQNMDHDREQETPTPE